MLNKKIYYISIDSNEIREVSIPDSEKEYEIIATPENIKEIEILMRKQKQSSGDAVEYLAKPFHEQGTDDKRAEYDSSLIEIFKKIYELGTEKTKEEIKNIGPFYKEK